MPETIGEKVSRWDLAGRLTTAGEFFSTVHERLLFLQHLHYCQYIPTLGPDHDTDFESRLEKWLSNLSDEADQQTMLEYVPHIVFMGRDEFGKLYQSALRGPLNRWIIDELKLNFLSPGLDGRLAEELHQHTWFCALSDSMQISDFAHANQLGGINYRPDLRTLCKFGDMNKILDFMRTRSDALGRAVPLRRVVILEDFIGSGTQLEDAIPIIDAFLAAGIPILMIPLIICQTGIEKIKKQWGFNPQFRLEPILELPPELLVNQLSTLKPGSLAEKVRDLALRTYSQVEGDKSSAPRPYGPFGVFHTGASLVMYSNTPANTLSFVQHGSNTWKPLFPRSARVK